MKYYLRCIYCRRSKITYNWKNDEIKNTKGLSNKCPISKSKPDKIYVVIDKNEELEFLNYRNLVHESRMFKIDPKAIMAQRLKPNIKHEFIRCDDIKKLFKKPLKLK